MEKFKNKYRVNSTRLQAWDYGWDGAYFITLCTHQRKHYFGEIYNGNMQLSPIGMLADVFWYEIKNHAINVELGAFIVMPNHIHGILRLKNNFSASRDKACLVSTQGNDISPKIIGKQRFQNQGKNTISSIIGSYKSAVTKHIHRFGYEFVWQPRFYDHIIRNDESYHYLENYILTNPQNWEADRFYAKILEL